MRKSIRSKLLAAFLMIIAVSVIAEGFFVIVNFNIVGKYRDLTDSMISEYRLIDTTFNLIESFKSSVKYTNDRAKSNEFYEARRELKDLLVKLDRVIVDSNSRITYIGLKNTIDNVLAEVDDGVNEAGQGDYSEMTSHYDNANRFYAFVTDNTTQLILQQLSYAKILEAKINQVQLWGEIIAILMFILAVAGCIWYAVTFSKKLVLPLVDLTKLAKIIEGGDLNATVKQKLLTGDDEVASLANSFHAMVLYLRESINRLQEYNLEIKNSRNRLKSEKHKLQQYLDIAGVIVLISSPSSNNVLLINKKGREVLGVENSEIIGKDWLSLFVAKNSRVETKSFLNLLAAGLTPVQDTLENVLVAKNQKEKNIIWHFSALKKESGEIEAILATGVDITELTAAKITINQLKEVDRLKNEVMNIATHELKTPLISIVGLSEVMEKKPETLSPDYRNYVSIIHQEGLKLTNLIKSMLSANRNELGKIVIVKEKFNLADLILSLETTLKVLTKRTDSQIAFVLKTKEVNLESDKTKISQVIYNFVDNAVKYGPKNQTITITLTKPKVNQAKIEVSGMGAGISEDDQKKLFLKFSQLEPSLSRSQDGMGLGLYICKQNIENLGGTIGVASSPNKGATFYFTLPLTLTSKVSASTAKSPVKVKATKK